MTDTRTEARKLLDRHVSEKDFQQQIIDAARAAGWKVYHTYESRRSEPGFPDLIMLHWARGALGVLEVKSERGRATQAQHGWLDAWASVIAHITGLDVALCSDVMIDVVRPRDWDRIEAFLAAKRGDLPPTSPHRPRATAR